ncbi:MAG: hypothetical protein ACRYFX_15620 [Janthinobacterium lividum]
MGGKRAGKQLKLSGKKKRYWKPSNLNRCQYTSTSKMLATFGYSEQWLEYGILTTKFLTKQYRVFHSSEDKHTEHYRYGAFRNFLDHRISLTDQELAGYLQLTLTDKYFIMGGAAAQDLFTEVALTTEQFEWVCKKIGEFPGDWTAKLLTRQRLLRQLKNTELTAPLFEECLANSDGVVQKSLLALADAAQLRELSDKGVTSEVVRLGRTV